jgi:hypothetical protein
MRALFLRRTKRSDAPAKGDEPAAAAEPALKNPDQLRCPRCNGIRLIVEKDRSAYCVDCKRGIHPQLWTPKSG